MVSSSLLWLCTHIKILHYIILIIEKKLIVKIVQIPDQGLCGVHEEQTCCKPNRTEDELKRKSYCVNFPCANFLRNFPATNVNLFTFMCACTFLPEFHTNTSKDSKKPLWIHIHLGLLGFHAN